MRTIHHGETADGRRFTVVGLYGKEVGKGKVKFGVAICGPQDNFARKIGRKIAEGRAIKHPTLEKIVSVELNEDKEGFSILSKLGYEVVETVAEDPYLYQEILTQQHKEIEEKREREKIEKKLKNQE